MYHFERPRIWEHSTCETLTLRGPWQWSVRLKWSHPVTNLQFATFSDLHHLQNILSAVASNSSHGRPSHQCGWNFLWRVASHRRLAPSVSSGIGGVLFSDLRERSAPSLYSKNGIMSFSAVFCKKYYKPYRASDPEIFTRPIPILQAPDIRLVLSRLPSWSSIVGVTVTVHQFFCILYFWPWSVCGIQFSVFFGVPEILT